MGLFGKKREVNPESEKLNELLKLSLLQQDITADEETLKLIETVKFQVDEYTRQLKEAVVYSKGAVKKFIQDEHPWVNKENNAKLIEIGLSKLG